MPEHARQRGSGSGCVHPCGTLQMPAPVWRVFWYAGSGVSRSGARLGLSEMPFESDKKSGKVGMTFPDFDL